MGVYTANTIVNYRGFLIGVEVTLSRDDMKGLKRHVRSEFEGYLTDVFEEDRPDDEIDRIELNTQTVDYVPQDCTDLDAAETQSTYLENNYYNWGDRSPTGDPFIDVFRHIRGTVFSHPTPTPLSQQIEQTITNVQEDIDQFIEDRYIDFDESELQHGLENTLSKPVDDLSVDTQTPTDNYDETITSPDRLADRLAPGQSDLDHSADSQDGEEILVLDGLEDPIHLSDDEDGYRQAQRLLNRADIGNLTLTQSDRDQLNTFIREYQTSRLRL